MKKKFGLFLVVSFGILFISLNTYADTTFLPDWIEKNPGSQDEDFCLNAKDSLGNPLYHKASGCPDPKMFDEYCPHDHSYISKCYCPSKFDKECNAPYKGDTRFTHDNHASCNNLWLACCDPRCPKGTSTQHPGGCPSVEGENECGEKCYGPYKECCKSLPDDVNCGKCGTEKCSDGCGGTRNCCKKCDDDETTDPVPDPNPDPDPDPDPQPEWNDEIIDPCENVSCPTGIYCAPGKCDVYTSQPCCSMVCTKCKE